MNASSNDLCRICSGETLPLLNFEVCGAYDADLIRCSVCGFSFISDPWWLESTFEDRLHRMDVGSLERSLYVARFLKGVSVLIKRWKDQPMLDFGAGDGVLVRHLRDRGLQIRYSDPFASPVFFVGDAINEDDKFELSVLSEVALHFVDPLQEFKSLLVRSNQVLFTAVKAPEKIDENWWYLMKSTGQHVAFYSKKSIDKLAKELGCHSYGKGSFFHVISKEKIPWKIRLCLRYPAVPVALGLISEFVHYGRRALGKGVSLTEHDQEIVEKLLQLERKN